MSSYRSDRAKRRAAKLRNTRILIISVILLVIAMGAYYLFSIKDLEPVPTINASLITTGSGLQYADLVIGDGAEAVVGKTVEVHYTGWLEDGTVFDSSLKRGKPFSFILGAGNVIKGWDEGVAGMRAGGKRRLVIPPELGYGSNGIKDVIPPNATLTFDVELINLK